MADQTIETLRLMAKCCEGDNSGLCRLTDDEKAALDRAARAVEIVERLAAVYWPEEALAIWRTEIRRWREDTERR